AEPTARLPLSPRANAAARPTWRGSPEPGTDLLFRDEVLVDLDHSKRSWTRRNRQLRRVTRPGGRLTHRRVRTEDPALAGAADHRVGNRGARHGTPRPPPLEQIFRLPFLLV